MDILGAAAEEHRLGHLELEAAGGNVGAGKLLGAPSSAPSDPPSHAGDTGEADLPTEPEQERSHGPAQARRAQLLNGADSQFAVQWLVDENAPLLLVRLPRLASLERRSLEARAAELFQTFGLRRAKLLLRETMGK